MKVIEISIKAPKCGASSEALKSAFAVMLGADEGYVGARLAIMPPDVKSVINGAVKSVNKVYKDLTLPWIGTKRVCEDNKVEIVKEEINNAANKAKKIIAEQREAMRIWLPKVVSALGDGASLIELPDPNDFDLTVLVSSSEPEKATKGMVKSATDVETNKAIAKGVGYENLINHLVEQVEKIGNGKKASAAALRFKEDANTAAKMGAVDKEQLVQINSLIGALLKAGNNAVKKAGAKAAVVSAIIDSATPPETETEAEVEEKDEGKVPTKKLPKRKGQNTTHDQAVQLI